MREPLDDDEKIIPLREPVLIGEAGGMVDESKVTLAVYAVDLDPDAISCLLGAQPTEAHRRGERRSARSVPSKEGAWMLTLEGAAPIGPDELTTLLLERFPADREFWDRLRDNRTVKVIYFIFQSTWNRGFALRAETVALLARTGAVIEFDVYCEGQDGE